MSDSRWQRIEEIFHQAVELRPEARSALLDELCVADPSLRKEVESLLSHDNEHGSTFAAPRAASGLTVTDPRFIAHYRISGKLGEGGMGAVYRATDTKLNREVAIKVLPAGLANDPGRMARFEREAQVLASLNHPRIAQIYGVEDGALVMELVPGHVLKGPLPLETALDYARQIAEALEAAHEKGVVHRDLKPANVMVTPGGAIKVLDFGLAKVRPAGEPLALDDSAAATATESGVILGTAAYMPPEQACGAVVDKRADIWAYGCVLYEMLSGKRTFPGGSTANVLAAVVHGEPDWSALPAATPDSVRRLLKRCLEKDRKRRLPDIGVAKLEIDDALVAPGSPGEAATRPKQRSKLLWKVAAGAALLIAAAAAGWQAKRTPGQESWSGMMLGGPAKAFEPRLSPDGQLLAFLVFVDQLPQLGVMKPNGGSWTIRTSDREHGYIATAAWAPDGSKIYFDRMWGHPLGIYSVPPLGGEPRVLLDEAFGPEPLPDGSLIVVKLTDKGDNQLFHFWPASGKLEALPAFLPKSDITPMLRAFPGGKELLYFGSSEKERSRSARLMIFDLASRQARELSPGLNIDPGGDNWAPMSIAPDGESFYISSKDGDSRSLLAIARKPGSKPRSILQFPAPAVPVAMDTARDGSIYLDLLRTLAVVLRVNAAGGTGEEFVLPGMEFSTMVATGGEVLISMIGWGRQRLAALRPGGEPRVLVETDEDTTLPATTFGGNVAFVIGSGDRRRIAIASLRDGHVLRRFSTRSDSGMAASADGLTLYYSFNGAIWAQPVSGGDPRRVTEGIDVTLDPKGRYLYVKRADKGVMRMFRIPVSGGESQELPIPSEYHIANPLLSPVAVDERGRILVSVLSKHSFYYQTAILDPASKSFTLAPIAFDGDTAPAGWAPDGRILVRGQQYLFSLWRYQRSGLR